MTSRLEEYASAESADLLAQLERHATVADGESAELLKACADALQYELARSQRLLDAVDAVIVGLNPQGQVTLINRKGCELLGYSEQELVGRFWFETCLPQPEGSEVVFWTLIEGGASGDSVDHVWIREGEEVVTVGLAVGSAHWRTWSKKTLYPGSAGSWSVEARDRDGQVLASVSFTCTPATETPAE